MAPFPIHDLDTAPQASRDSLQAAKQAFGGIPNLIGVLGASPAAAKAYLELGRTFDELTAFDAAERQVVLISTSFENECTYCVAAHTAISGMQKVPEDVVTALRNGTPLPNEKLEALRSFTLQVVRRRGNVSGEDVSAFLAAGYEQRHVLEVVLGVAFKTLSNYANHLARTPLDKNFQPFAWTRPVAAVA